MNINTKEPSRNSAQIQNITSLIGGKAWDNNTAMNASLVTSDGRIGLFLFGVLRERQAYDHDGDGFSEIPSLRSNMLGFRSYFKTSDYSKLTAGYHHMGGKRRGGSEMGKQPHESELGEQCGRDVDAGSLRFDCLALN